MEKRTLIQNTALAIGLSLLTACSSSRVPTHKPASAKTDPTKPSITQASAKQSIAGQNASRQSQREVAAPRTQPNASHSAPQHVTKHYQKPASRLPSSQKQHRKAPGFTGKASYYGKRFHGRTTASGERFNMYAMTAAHKKLPFGTRVKVTNLENGKSVIVTINDRGPYAKRRVIDLSKAAARKIDMLRAGVVRVRVEKIN